MVRPATAAQRKGRPRTADGKRVVIPVRVSDPKKAAIDAARGDTPASVWVEAAIDAALAADAAPSPGRTRPACTEPPPVKPASPGPLPQPSTGQRCTHSGTRVIGGYCKHCDHLIEPGGRWRT